MELLICSSDLHPISLDLSVLYSSTLPRSWYLVFFHARLILVKPFHFTTTQHTSTPGPIWGNISNTMPIWLLATKLFETCHLKKMWQEYSSIRLTLKLVDSLLPGWQDINEKFEHIIPRNHLLHCLLFYTCLLYKWISTNLQIAGDNLTMFDWPAPFFNVGDQEHKGSSHSHNCCPGCSWWMRLISQLKQV